MIVRCCLTKTVERFGSYLLLSSDLRGYIESLRYYFTRQTEVGQKPDHPFSPEGWKGFTFKRALEQQWQNPE